MPNRPEARPLSYAGGAHADADPGLRARRDAVSPADLGWGGDKLVPAVKYGSVALATVAALALVLAMVSPMLTLRKAIRPRTAGRLRRSRVKGDASTDPAAKSRSGRKHPATQPKSRTQSSREESGGGSGQSAQDSETGPPASDRRNDVSLPTPGGAPRRDVPSENEADGSERAGGRDVPTHAARPVKPFHRTAPGANDSSSSVGGVSGRPRSATESAAVTPTPVGIARVAASVTNPLIDTGPAGKPVEPPFASALLAWVRRSFFNKSPSLHYDPTINVQAQYGVVTGNIGAVDPEGDVIAYKLVKGPQHGIVTIDQASGSFTYTPDLDYAQAGGSDSFVVKVTDNVWSVRDLFRWDHGSRKAVIGLSVDSILPSAQRFVVPLPDDILQPQNAAFTADGQALVFRATPAGGTRSEIYRVNLDGTGLQCLTAGLAPDLTTNLSKPFVFDDGNRVLLSAGTQSDSGGGETADHYILECAGGGVSSCGAGSTLLQIRVPTTVAPGVTVIQKERELRVAPDGIHVGFTQLLGAGTATQLVSSVGTLQRSDTGYDVEDARVVYVGGELKNFTPDGKGVMVTDFSGKYEAGNADDVLVDLGSGRVSRITGNLDYDESVDMSPNGGNGWRSAAREQGTISPPRCRRSFVPRSFLLTLSSPPRFRQRRARSTKPGSFRVRVSLPVRTECSSATRAEHISLFRWQIGVRMATASRSGSAVRPIRPIPAWWWRSCTILTAERCRPISPPPPIRRRGRGAVDRCAEADPPVGASRAAGWGDGPTWSPPKTAISPQQS